MHVVWILEIVDVGDFCVPQSGQTWAALWGVSRPSIYGNPLLTTGQLACRRAQLTQCGPAHASGALPSALILSR
jgi:hypothetical protein